MEASREVAAASKETRGKASTESKEAGSKVGKAVKGDGGKGKVTGKKIMVLQSLGLPDLPSLSMAGMMKPLRGGHLTFKERWVRRGWADVGINPFTQKCLMHPKVCKEIGQEGGGMGDLEKLEAEYKSLVAQTETEGFNPVFNLELTRVPKFDRPETEEEQVAKLVNHSGAYYSSVLF